MDCTSTLLHALFICYQFFVALGNLTIDYILHQQPNTPPRNASIVIDITCNWGISTNSVSIVSEEGGQVFDSCNGSSSFQSTNIFLTCTDLNDDTFYDASIQATVQIDNESYPLQFTISFHTEDNGLLLSSKL